MGRGHTISDVMDAQVISRVTEGKFPRNFSHQNVILIFLII